MHAGGSRAALEVEGKPGVFAGAEHLRAPLLSTAVCSEGSWKEPAAGAEHSSQHVCEFPSTVLYRYCILCKSTSIKVKPSLSQ